MAGPRLLERVRGAIRARHYSYRTEQAYVHWIRRFIRFHGRRHPAEMGKREVEVFLTDLAVRRIVSASTQNQALSAILFLYKAVLEQELLGHSSLQTTMIDTHVLQRGALGVRSPAHTVARHPPEEGRR